MMMISTLLGWVHQIKPNALKRSNCLFTFFTFIYHGLSTISIMVLTLESNAEYVAHVWRAPVFYEHYFKFATVIDLNALNRSNYRFLSTLAHLFLNYHHTFSNMISISFYLPVRRKWRNTRLIIKDQLPVLDYIYIYILYIYIYIYIYVYNGLLHEHP